MRRVMSALTLLTAFVAAAVASELTTEQPRNHVDGTLIAEGSLIDVQVVLNHGAYSALPRQDGSFVFHAVAEGSYLLEVYDTQRAWPTVRVEVGQAISGTVRATRTHDRLQLSTPMQLAPLLQDRKFFEERPSFQWSSLFMNPMVIMMLVSGGIMFVMPKMMANIDPEELKKMTEMQNAQSSLSFSDLLNPDKLKEKAALLDDTKGKKGKAK